MSESEDTTARLVTLARIAAAERLAARLHRHDAERRNLIWRYAMLPASLRLEHGKVGHERKVARCPDCYPEHREPDDFLPSESEILAAERTYLRYEVMRQERAADGLPCIDAAMAEALGVGERTIREWRKSWRRAGIPL